MRRYTLALAEAKLTPVGRAGTFSPLSGQAEADYLAAVAGGAEPFRDLLRRFVEPPVLEPDGQAHLTAFAVA